MECKGKVAHRSRQNAQFHICCCSLFTNIKNYKELTIFILTQNKTTSPSRRFANSCSSPKGLFYIFKIHLKSLLLLDYQQYNADRCYWTQHIAQLDFHSDFFLILNSAKGIFFFLFKTGMFQSLSQKIYFVQWTADIINKINMGGGKKSNFVRKIK